MQALSDRRGIIKGLMCFAGDLGMIVRSHLVDFLGRLLFQSCILDRFPTVQAASLMKLSAICLDIGNVICEWNPQKLIDGAFPDSADHAAALAATIGHADWLELDKGTMTVAEATANAISRSDLNPDRLAAVYQDLPASLVPLPDTVAAMHEIREAGIPLYILSNMQKHAWDFMHKRDDFWSLVDKVVLSCDCNLIKPDAAIYEYLIAQCNLQPESSVFIDDMAENIEAAIQSGLQGIQLTDRNRGGEVIRELLAR